MRPRIRVQGLLLTTILLGAFAAIPSATAEDLPVAACSQLLPGEPCVEDAYDAAKACVTGLVANQSCSFEDLCDGSGIELCEPCAGSCNPCGFQLEDCVPCDGQGVVPCTDHIICDELSVEEYCMRCTADTCDPCWWEPLLCWGCTTTSCQVILCDGVREAVCQSVEDCLEGRICDYWFCTAEVCDLSDGHTCVLSGGYEPVGACAVHDAPCYGALVAHGFYASGAVACYQVRGGTAACAYLVLNSGPFGTVCVWATSTETCVVGGGQMWNLGPICGPSPHPLLP